MKILGIETSCDETAAAVIENGVKVLSNVVASSESLHQKTGGIVPEVAAREQVRCMIPVVKEALKQALLAPRKLDAVAVAVGPGLIGSLLVGTETAKTLSFIWKKPLVPINHLIGHIYGSFITENRTPAANTPTVKFPAIALIVSGGHTELILIKNHGNFHRLGGTRDDAAGEAFDKVARMLTLGYPGGPAIQQNAQNGNPNAFVLPRPLINNHEADFSFSGLKTAVLRKLQTEPFQPPVPDLAASFQQAVVDVLVAKTTQAAQKYNARSVILAGGVAANVKLRQSLKAAIKGLLPATTYLQPAMQYCTDNASMTASAAYFNYDQWALDPSIKKGLTKILTLTPNPNLTIN